MKARRGVALVVVLWTIALLATAAALAGSAARTSASVTSNARAQSVSRAMAESGVVAATTLIDDSLLAYAPHSTERATFLLRLEPTSASALPLVQDTLDDGVLAVTVVDVSARLDVNNAGAEGLARLFATVTTPDVARSMGERIDAIVRGDIGADGRSAGAQTAEARNATERLRARDSLNATLLGRAPGPQLRRPFESLDALRDVAGLDQSVLSRVAEFLTVDGDGHVNRRAAPREVLRAASGSLVDEPTRLLVIARGWQRGHVLTRQIEAVYDITDDGLRLVRWRERDL